MPKDDESRTNSKHFQPNKKFKITIFTDEILKNNVEIWGLPRISWKILKIWTEIFDKSETNTASLRSLTSEFLDPQNRNRNRDETSVSGSQGNGTIDDKGKEIKYHGFINISEWNPRKYHRNLRIAMDFIKYIEDLKKHKSSD